MLPPQPHGKEAPVTGTSLRSSRARLDSERFGGLAMGVTEGPMKWMAKEADVVFAGAALHLVIHYRTSRLDPTLAT